MFDEEAAKQPLAPAVRMIWFFVAVTVCALVMVFFQTAFQGSGALKALLLLCVWAMVLWILYAVNFLAAFVFGWLQRLIEPPGPSSVSPFAQDSLPQQQVEPLRVDER